MMWWGKRGAGGVGAVVDMLFSWEGYSGGGEKVEHGAGVGGGGGAWALFLVERWRALV